MATTQRLSKASGRIEREILSLQAPPDVSAGGPLAGREAAGVVTISREVRGPDPAW